MKYHLVCGNLIKNYQNINIKDNLKEYINNNRELLNHIYFKVKNEWRCSFKYNYKTLVSEGNVLIKLYEIL